MADGGFADQSVQNFAVENLRHEAHAVVLVKFSLVAGDDARAFLPAMLERVKSVVSQFGGVRMAENAEDSAVMFGIILHRTATTGSRLRSILAEKNCGRNLVVGQFEIISPLAPVWYHVANSARYLKAVWLGGEILYTSLCYRGSLDISEPPRFYMP